MTSQSKEDRHLLSIFPGICNGTYIEMGALDGIQYSNTYVFHKALSWKGVLVEISPKNFARLQKNRPNELALVHAGVCKEEGTVHFMDMASAVSGVWEFAPPPFRNYWWKGKTLEDTTPIRCVPLRAILAEQGPTFFADFFSLDVEGAELQAPPPPPPSPPRGLFLL
jgi:FkbM family methyltransferase